MKIQSRTAKILKYPALTTLAAMVGTLNASEKPEQVPAKPAEEQTTTQPPQPYSGIVASDSTEQQEEVEPEYFLGEIPMPTESDEEEAIIEPEPTVIPQNAVGSVPCPPQQRQ